MFRRDGRSRVRARVRRDRQPEGRRRQDDDRDQSRHGAGRVGERVLVLDLDSQGNASTGLGIAADSAPRTSFDVLTGTLRILDAASADARCRACTSCRRTRSRRHRRALQRRPTRGLQAARRDDGAVAHQRSLPPDKHFNYVLIDCPPSLNLLTLNAMTAAHAVLVPVQCEFFALEGISQLKDTIDQIRATLNPRLEIQGVVLTMHDARTVALARGRRQRARLLRAEGLRDHHPAQHRASPRRRRTASRSCSTITIAPAAKPTSARDRNHRARKASTKAGLRSAETAEETPMNAPLPKSRSGAGLPR